MSENFPKNLTDTPETRPRAITKERMLEILEEEDINFVRTEDGEAEVYFHADPGDSYMSWEHFSPDRIEKDFRERVRRLKKTYPDVVRKPIMVKENFLEE